MTVGIPDFYFNFAHNLLALTFLVNFALVYAECLVERKNGNNLKLNALIE